MIYLDNAATTFPKPEEVYSAVNFIQRELAVNVGRGSYKAAGAAQEILDETRSMLARLVGAKGPDSVIFTPSATIAANEIIYGLKWDKSKNVYVSPFEHNAIARPLHRKCSEFGLKINILPFDPLTQEWNVAETERLFLLSPPDYVFLNHVSNVTGAILPINQIALLAKEYGAVVVVDGSQSVGLLDYAICNSQIDFLIFAGHKNLYASFGVGGWVANSSYPLTPVLSGGTGSDSLNLNMSQITPIGFEPGSPNILAIGSLNASLKWLNSTGIRTISEKKRSLMETLVNGLSRTGAVLYNPGPNVGHTSVLSFTLPGYDSNDVGTILSGDYDIAVRTGYHCAPFVHDFLGTKGSQGTIRISVGYFNSMADIDALLRAINEL